MFERVGEDPQMAAALDRHEREVLAKCFRRRRRRDHRRAAALVALRGAGLAARPRVFAPRVPPPPPTCRPRRRPLLGNRPDRKRLVPRRLYGAAESGEQSHGPARSLSPTESPSYGPARPVLKRVVAPPPLGSKSHDKKSCVVRWQNALLFGLLCFDGSDWHLSRPGASRS